MSDYQKIKLKNGETRYRKYVSLGTVNGKRKSTRITAKTVKELRQKEAELTLGNATIKSNANQSISFITAYDLYVKEFAKSHALVTVQKKMYEKNKYKMLYDRPLAQITERDIQEWIDSLNTSIGSVKTLFADLSAFFNWCVKKKLIEHNPMRFLDKPRAPTIEKAYIKENDLWKIVSCIDDFSAKVIIVTLFYCGLRKSEVCGLSLNDLQDFELHLSHTAKFISNKGNLIFTQFKNQQSKRIVPIPRFLKADLEKALSAKEYPFKNYYTTINRTLNIALKKADVKHIRIHDLRHSYASLLISKGVDIYTVSKLMGHSNVSITSGLYAHLYDEKRKAVTDLL